MALMEAISCSATTWSGGFGAGMSSGAGLIRGSGVTAAAPCACVGLESTWVGGRNELIGSGVALEVGRRASFGRGTNNVVRRGGVMVFARSGGSSNYRPPRPPPPRRSSSQQQDSSRDDGPLMNNDIRAPQVRLLDEDQNMIGVVATSEALQRSRDADLDLVMISPDADPPVVRIMDYSKYRYEQQKRKREAQKKAAASRQELKELKMRYNIDTHDFSVRQRAAQRFLKDGDKVKVVCQFKGRELDFKDLAVKLFERFHEELGESALLETKISMEGKTLYMVLTPNKAALVKAQAAAQSLANKSKNQTTDTGDVEEQSKEEEPLPVA